MKIKTCLALLTLGMIGSVIGQEATVTADGSGTALVEIQETGTNPDGSINWSFYAKAAGKFYVGAMSGTQKDIQMKTGNCYEYAEIFEDELVNKLFKNGIDFAIILNRIQIAQVKLQTSFEACGVDVMIEQLDKRMSDLDYTLALISNVIAQFFAGFESQNWTGYIDPKTGNMYPNPVNNMVYNAYN